MLIADDFAFPNGVWLSADERTLYANDTTHNHVRAFDVNADGSVTGGRVFLEQPGGDLTIGAPNGMACDIHGNLSAATGPHGVWVVTPDAQVLGIVRTPASLRVERHLRRQRLERRLHHRPGHRLAGSPRRTRAARSAHVVQGELQQVAKQYVL